MRTRDPPKAPPGRRIWCSGTLTVGAPNRLWVSDLTYVATWAGVAYVCFIVDVFGRMIVTWRVAAHMRTSIVLDALEMARASRGAHLAGLVAHSDAGQFTSWAVHPTRPGLRAQRVDELDRGLLR